MISLKKNAGKMLFPYRTEEALNQICHEFGQALNLANQPDSDGQKEAKDSIKSGLQQAIVKEKPNVKWSDVAGLTKAK